MARSGGTYQNGHKSKGARPPGSVNKITRDLKHGIIEAAVAFGSNGKGAGGLQGFFKYLILNDLGAFASLIGRILPLQVNGNINATIGTVNIVGVPNDRYLTAEQVKAMMPDYEPVVIDIAPTNVVELEPSEDVA